MFDVVCGYSILEHLANPAAFLKNVVQLINPDGILVMRVPNTPNNGPTLSLVDHFWHFTEASLRTIMAMNGLTVVDIFPSGSFKGIQHPGELKSMTVIATPAR